MFVVQVPSYKFSKRNLVPWSVNTALLSRQTLRQAFLQIGCERWRWIGGPLFQPECDPDSCHFDHSSAASAPVRAGCHRWGSIRYRGRSPACFSRYLHFSLDSWFWTKLSFTFFHILEQKYDFPTHVGSVRYNDLEEVWTTGHIIQI